MRGGVILIAIALLIAYLGVTGRYKCFGVFFNCIIDPSFCPGCGGGGESGQGSKEGHIEVTPGNSGVNPTGAPVYDATTHYTALAPIEPFV